MTLKKIIKKCVSTWSHSRGSGVVWESPVGRQRGVNSQATAATNQTSHCVTGVVSTHVECIQDFFAQIIQSQPYEHENDSA